MQRRFRAAAVGRIAAARRGIVRRTQFCDVFRPRLSSRPLQVMKYADRNRTSRPGARRKNFFGGSSMKSSRSM